MSGIVRKLLEKMSIYNSKKLVSQNDPIARCKLNSTSIVKNDKFK